MANFGPEVWYEADKAEVDIVFVHGLRGGRESTWTKGKCLWPRDLLPHDIPSSRIIGYGYDSGIVHADSAQVVQGSIEHDAQRLCVLLDELRVKSDTASRPIVTVGHSLGGLVLAQVIYGGDKAAQGNSIHSISEKVVGMLFLGTPFYGSPGATWADSFRKIIALIRETDRNTLEGLKLDSQILQSLRDGFPQAIQRRGKSDSKIGVSYCFEKLKTGVQLIVPGPNARYPGVGNEAIPMNTNHIDICKFDRANDDNYKIVKGEIQKLIVASSESPSEKNGSKNVVKISDNGKILNMVMEGDLNIQTQNNQF